MIEIWRRGGKNNYISQIYISKFKFFDTILPQTTSPFESRCSGQVHSAKFERRGNRDIVARNEPYIRKLRHSVPRYSRIDSASVLAPAKILLCT